MYPKSALIMCIGTCVKGGFQVHINTHLLTLHIFEVNRPKVNNPSEGLERMISNRSSAVKCPGDTHQHTVRTPVKVHTLAVT